MPVYFIQRGDDGPVKIGVAKDVARRLTFLRTSSAENLTVRAIYAGDLQEWRAKEWLVEAQQNIARAAQDYPGGLAAIRCADRTENCGYGVARDIVSLTQEIDAFLPNRIGPALAPQRAAPFVNQFGVQPIHAQTLEHEA